MNYTDAGLAESWNRTLSGIPTMLGRLAWLASLRNTSTGSYEHFGMAQRSSSSDVDRLVRASHMEAFQAWLCFSLRQQKEEVELYFEGLGEDRRETLANWLRVTPCGSWIPAESRDVERTLFLSDLEIILESFRTDFGVAARNPDL